LQRKPGGVKVAPIRRIGDRIPELRATIGRGAGTRPRGRMAALACLARLIRMRGA